MSISSPENKGNKMVLFKCGGPFWEILYLSLLVDFRDKISLVNGNKDLSRLEILDKPQAMWNVNIKDIRSTPER